MTGKSELDAIDRKVLRVLAADGRASYQGVADLVGLSRPAVMERVRRLEQAGYITGYAARIDRARMGFPVTAFVAVRYPTQGFSGHEARIQELAAHANVLECHHVAGEDCYILKVATASLERLQGLLRDLHGPAGTTTVNTRTTIVLSTLFEKPGMVPAERD